MADAVAAPLLRQPQPAAEHGVVGESPASAPADARPQLVARPASSSSCRAAVLMLVVDQDAARQDAERAFQHAHVLVEHHMRDVGALEQRLDRGDQHGIVGADELAQGVSPYQLRRRSSAGARCAR